MLVEFHALGAGRLGAGGDDNAFPADRGALTTGTVFDEQGVLVAEPRLARNEVNSVAHQLVSNHVGLLADHMLGPRQQVRRGDLVLDAVAGAVELTLIHAGQVEHGLAQRLGRDGAGVDAHAAEHWTLFDDRDRFAQLGRGDRGFLAART